MDRWHEEANILGRGAGGSPNLSQWIGRKAYPLLAFGYGSSFSKGMLNWIGGGGEEESSENDDGAGGGIMHGFGYSYKEAR